MPPNIVFESIPMESPLPVLTFALTLAHGPSEIDGASPLFLGMPDSHAMNELAASRFRLLRKDLVAYPSNLGP